jgi:putative phosphoribosyl transferase
MEAQREMEQATGTNRQSVRVEAGSVTLEGDLDVPAGARGLVLFAHGSGSSRLSPRNRRVADALGRRRIATLLIDLLTEEEEEIDASTGSLRFDIELLARRLAGATDWAGRRRDLEKLPIGYFGASTGSGAARVAGGAPPAGVGAAAALIAAAERPAVVRAVVSRGGRPDLARPVLAQVRAPTLLIVGGRDLEVVELNRHAYAVIRADKRLEIIPGATHLFEEPGALEQVAARAGEWFEERLFA